MSTAVTAAVRRVLQQARTDGNLLYLPEGRLAPRLYAQVGRVLEAAGGYWSGGRVQAHVFPGEAAEALAGILTAGRVTSAKQAQQWYATPAGVVDELIAAAELTPGLEVLEPSAGAGAIALAVSRRGCLVDCIELDRDRAAALQAAGMARTVRCADFLACPPEARYDRVVMNPPFTGNADTRHVEHALRYLRPGGVLAAVMAAGVEFRCDQAAGRIRELAGGAIMKLPAASFREAGTSIDTVIVAIRLPGGTPAAEPVRVTFDPAAAGQQLFHPATARHRAYIRWDSAWAKDRTFRFAGNCVGCGRPTWQHDDGEDDTRGDFGFWTGCPLDASSFTPGQVPAGASWPRCASCWDDYATNQKAVGQALAQLAAAA